MTTISTLSEFLLQAGTEYRVYDIGRGIRSLSDQTFMDIELGMQPYPYPRQAHAWLGIVFWNKSLSNEHYIWFLKFALDETSTLISGPRDHFLNLVVEALGKESTDTSNTLSKTENPYSFTPSQQTLADFNALIKTALSLAPSIYYKEIIQFLNAPSVVNWQQLAAQGISDFCSRLTEANNTSLLTQAYPALAHTVKNAILSSLENYALDEQLATVLITYAKSTPNDVNVAALTLRALAQSQHYPLVQEYIFGVIQSENATDINILSVVVARHWQLLIDGPIIILLLEHAAAINIEVCTGLYKDLVMIPMMRQRMLSILSQETGTNNPVLNKCLIQLKRELMK